MKLVAIPDVDGDALSIIDSNHAHEDCILIDDSDDIKDHCTFEELIDMLISFNE